MKWGLQQKGNVMRAAWCAGFAAVFVCVASAFAQEAPVAPAAESLNQAAPPTRLFVEVAAGSGYSFTDNSAAPLFDEASINTSYSFGVTRSDWTLTFTYLEAKSDQEGNQVSLGYRKNEGCPLFGRDSTLGCSLGLQVRDVEDQETVRYSAGVRGPLAFARNANFSPAWVVNGAALGGDRTETTLGAGVELPVSFDARDPSNVARPDWRWTVTGTANVLHGFESGTTLPTWGIIVRYNFTSDVNLSLGYESRAVLDPDDEGDLDVDRVATAKFKITF